MARAKQDRQNGNSTKSESKIYLARYFGQHMLTKYTPTALAQIVTIIKLIERHGRVRVSAMFEGRETSFKKRDTLRGFMRKLVEDGLLFSLTFSGKDEGRTTYYFANSDHFYKAERLVKLLPREEIDRIASHVGDKPLSLHTLTHRLYGDRSHLPTFIVTGVLAQFISHGLVAETRQGYVLTKRGQHFGADTATIEHLNDAELEYQALVKEEGAPADPDKLTLEHVTGYVADSLASKRIKSIDLSEELQKRPSWKLLPLTEVLFGNHFTDMSLLDFIRKTNRPDVCIVSGLVQGMFARRLKAKKAVLTREGGLHRLSHQLAAAGNLLASLESITRDKVFYAFGDDDIEVATDFADLMQSLEGKGGWKIWSTNSHEGEIKNRLAHDEYLRKVALQLLHIMPYQFRLGRGLKNRDEVDAVIGVRKNEYRLIAEILAHVRKNDGWPDLERGDQWWPEEYEDVVNIDALQGDLGKRVVTPDSLSLIVPGSLSGALGHDEKENNGERKKREILFVHNTNYSNITQYTDTVSALENSIRKRLAARQKVPFMTMDGQQEKFYLGYTGGEPNSGGHWFMNLPGLQNPMQEAEHRMTVGHRGALTSKSHRQATVRKDLTTSGAPEFEFCNDGRVRIRLINNTMRRVLEAQKDKPEVREVIAYVADLQTGSITMCPEVAIKYLDYALYARKAKKLLENGDIIQGGNYNQHPIESQMLRLVGVANQQRFVRMTQAPLLERAPGLETVVLLEGNHEWNTRGHDRTGPNYVDFIEHYLQGVIDARRRDNTPTPLKEVLTAGMVRVGRVSNPFGANVVAWPYYTSEVGGFKFAFSHLWNLFGGGGRTPVDKQRKWLTGMAHVAGDIDFMFGGHYHSLWMCQEADKLCVQVPAAASQSGYELMLALAPTTMMMLIEVSNREGVTLEFIPWEFLLHEYKCQSPFYKGRDDELLRPRPGTLEYRHGKQSALVERVIDEVNAPLACEV